MAAAPTVPRSTLVAECDTSEVFTGVTFTFYPDLQQGIPNDIVFWFGEVYMDEAKPIAELTDGQTPPRVAQPMYPVQLGGQEGTYEVKMPTTGIFEGEKFFHYVEYTVDGAIGNQSTAKTDLPSWDLPLACPPTMRAIADAEAAAAANSSSAGKSSQRGSTIAGGLIMGVAMMALLIAAAFARRRRQRAKLEYNEEPEVYDGIYRPGEENDFVASPGREEFKPQQHNRRAMEQVMAIKVGGKRRGSAGGSRGHDPDEVVV